MNAYTLHYKAKQQKHELNIEMDARIRIRVRARTRARVRARVRGQGSDFTNATKLLYISVCIYSTVNIQDALNNTYSIRVSFSYFGWL